MSLDFSSLKVALVYDRVNTPHGGAEEVLLTLHQLFPQAPLYTSVYNPQEAQWAKVFQVRSSFLQKIPGAKSRHRLLAWMMPLAFESFDFSEFEVIISITSAEAKGILTRPDQLHICYLLTPTRYLHSHQTHYLATLPIIAIPLGKILLQYLRWWDQAAAARPDKIIPISHLVAQRTQQYYHRTTEPVIYPPVTPLSPKSKLNPVHRNYFLVLSRLVSYKRIDLAIQACIQTQQKLVIVGAGPEKRKLQKLAKNYPNLISFRSAVKQHESAQLLSQAAALLMPGIEDFGITALEAVCLGTPVILQHQSGAAELIPNGVGSIHLHSETVAAVVKAISEIQNISMDTNKLNAIVSSCGTHQFQDTFRSAIVQFVKDFRLQLELK